MAEEVREGFDPSAEEFLQSVEDCKDSSLGEIKCLGEEVEAPMGSQKIIDALLRNSAMTPKEAGKILDEGLTALKRPESQKKQHLADFANNLLIKKDISFGTVEEVLQILSEAGKVPHQVGFSEEANGQFIVLEQQSI